MSGSRRSGHGAAAGALLRALGAVLANPLKHLLTTSSSSVTSRYPSPDYFPVTRRVSCYKAGKKPTGKHNQTKRQGDSKC